MLQKSLNDTIRYLGAQNKDVSKLQQYIGRSDQVCVGNSQCYQRENFTPVIAKHVHAEHAESSDFDFSSMIERLLHPASHTCPDITYKVKYDQQFLKQIGCYLKAYLCRIDHNNFIRKP